MKEIELRLEILRKDVGTILHGISGEEYSKYRGLFAKIMREIKELKEIKI